MRFIRNFVRFWLGVQALGVAVGLFSLYVILLTPHWSQRLLIYAPLIGAKFLMVVLDGASLAAWWALRKGKPSARKWAIAASILNLPIPYLWHLRASNLLVSFLHIHAGLAGTMIGLAGLIAFAPEKAAESTGPRAPKPVRIAGDGTSRITDHLGQAASIGIVWLSFVLWSTWATNNHLSYPGLLAFLAEMELAVLLTVFGHELGHLVAGWASGKMLRSFQVGPFRWAIRSGRWTFDLNLRKFDGGSVSMVAPDLKNMRSRKAFSLMGGPVASLVMGSFVLVLTLLAPRHAWEHSWTLLSMVATFSLSAFVVNLVPLKPDSLYSDGAQLYQIVNNGPWARVHFAFAMVTTSLVSPVRPRDFDVNLLHEAASAVPHGERGLLLRLFASIHYIDANRIPQAVASMEAAEALYHESIFEKPQEVCSEFVFVNAFYKQDLAAAERWSRRIDDSPKIDLDADYWRAKTALHWLRGEMEEARECWRRGDALALKLPAAGSYAFTRSCFAKLRAALDAPAIPSSLESLLALAAACDDAESRVLVEV